jgi:transposase-like protein
LNTPPQVDGLEQLSGPDSSRSGISGPCWRSGSDTEYTIQDVSGRILRPLHQRHSPEQRTALAAAFASGISQKDLAAKYGISIRSVKRLQLQEFIHDDTLLNDTVSPRRRLRIASRAVNGAEALIARIDPLSTDIRCRYVDALYDV